MAAVEVIQEEILVHTTAEKTGNRWWGEARVSGNVTIDGKHYEFNEVIPLRFVRVISTSAAGICPDCRHELVAGRCENVRCIRNPSP